MTPHHEHIHFTAKKIEEQKRIKESLKAKLAKQEVEKVKNELVDLMGIDVVTKLTSKRKRAYNSMTTSSQPKVQAINLVFIKITSKFEGDNHPNFSYYAVSPASLSSARSTFVLILILTAQSQIATVQLLVFNHGGWKSLRCQYMKCLDDSGVEEKMSEWDDNGSGSGG
ncbi:hypothetical protein Tco_0013834 [Tanacetum coccineum]